MKNFYNCYLLKFLGINAIVLFPFVLYREKVPSRSIVRHELVHLKQIKKNGIIKFYSRYLLEYFIGRKNGLSHFEAYKNISFEREAFDLP